jgi:hypothetical protein
MCHVRAKERDTFVARTNCRTASSLRGASAKLMARDSRAWHASTIIVQRTCNAGMASFVKALAREGAMTPKAVARLWHAVVGKVKKSLFLRPQSA